MCLTYFRPHVSGLTMYVQRLAGELAARGHEVTVLTSRYDRSLPREEVIEGVRIVRVPVWARVSKGVVMPMLIWSLRHARRHDVVSIHLPQLDGAAVALSGRVFRKPTVLSYHCDLRLPKGVVNRLADVIVAMMNDLAARLSHRVVASTQDFADHSPFLRRFRRKLVVIANPVAMDRPSCAAVADLRKRWRMGSGPVIGMATRLAAEKGVEYLVDAMPALIARYPDMEVVFAGQHDNVVGEAAYREMLEPRLRVLGDRWRFVGVLEAEDMPAFLGMLDVLVVCSINSTESFGLVQAEAMLCGTPAVATDLPGVRQPVALTGMGVVVPPRDAEALAAGISEVLDHPDRYAPPAEEVEAIFDIAKMVDAYEALFEELVVD
jgi:glycosyltransferase involved in cell wall biosynthesis